MTDHRARLNHNRSELRTLLLLGAFLAAVFVFFVQPERLDLTLSDAQCAALNQQWKTKFQEDFNFTNSWKREEFECPSTHSGLVRALQFLQELDIQGSAEINFYQRLRQGSGELHRDLLFSKAGRAIFSDRRIIVNDLVLVENNPVQIAGVLLHEMRHLEEGVNTHVPCKRDSTKICDAELLDQPQEGGAYNFNIYFLDLVRQRSNASEFHKKLARRDMQKILNAHFNKLPEGAAERYDLDPPDWMSAAQ